MLVALFSFISCEKSELATEELDLSSTEIQDDFEVTGKYTPAAVSKTYKFGQTVEEVFAKSRPSTLQAVTPWEQITKDEVRAVGIADNQVFNVVRNKYFSNYISAGWYWGIESVSIGPNESYGTNRWSQVSGAVIPEYRFYGQGDVSQNTGFALWRRVPGINAQVHPNNNAAGQVWLTSAESSSHTFTVESSTSVTAGGKIKVPFVAEGESSVEVTLGASYSYTTEKSFEENFYFPQVTRTLAPGESIRYVLEERWVPVQTEWKFPLQFKGNYVVSIENGLGSMSFLDKRKVNVSEFNSDYNDPSKYHTMEVEEYLSHEFRVAAYIIDHYGQVVP